MHTDIFTELSIIIAIGALVSFCMRLIRQPLILGYIITGLLVGPSLLHVVKDVNSIEVFSQIGITLLLFIIGLGLNPKVISEVGKVAGIAGTFQVAVTALLGFGAARAVGMSATEGIFVGVALSFSSTIIILKLLSDKKEQGRLYGKITIGILLIQDVLATVALIFLTANSNGSGFHASQLGFLVLKGAVLIITMFLVTNYVLPRLRTQIAGSQEFLFLFAVGWGLGVATLFKVIGFSIEIGSLIAGIALASSPYAQEIAARLRPLRDFFVVVFFINLGSTLNFSSFGSQIIPVLVFSLIVIFLKPLTALIPLGLLGYTKNTSFKASSSLAQVSEFSLVFAILGAKDGLISNQIVTVLTLVALVTVTCSSYFIIYADRLYHYLERHLALFERTHINGERESRIHYELVLFGYKKGGREFLKVFFSLKKRYVVVDYDPEVIDLMERRDVHYMYGDATDPELLEEINLEHAKLVVSTISDYPINMFVIKWLMKANPRAVFICSAENAHEASELYNEGAAYVIMPHYIGTEKIGAFIKKSGLKKSEFRKFREKHLVYLQDHFDDNPSKHHLHLGKAILDRMNTTVSSTTHLLTPKNKSS